MLVQTILVLLLMTVLFWYRWTHFSFSLVMIPLVNVDLSIFFVLDHFCSGLPSGSCGCGLLLHLLTNSSTLFLHVCISSSSSFSIINSFPWLGLMCNSLLSLSLNLPGFAFLNGSPLLKLLMDLTVFLFNDMPDTLPLLSTVTWFGLHQGCLYYWLFMLVGLFY